MTQINKLVIVGATGQTGRLALQIMEERNFPVKDLALVASEKSAGQTLEFQGKSHSVCALADFDFTGADMALFFVPTPVAAAFVPKATAAGCLVIDNSNQYRQDPDVPLMVPEINGHTIAYAHKKNIISNANCAAIQMIMAIKPLHDVAPIKRVVVSTYQSTAGAGYNARQELRAATQEAINGAPHTPENFPRDIAFNVIPQVDQLRAEDGRTVEEWKMQHDTSKIMEADFPISATCVRVPVQVGHSEAVNIEFESELSVEKAIELLKNAPGVVVQTNDADYITPAQIAGTDAVYVSRIRKDHSVEHGLNMWIVADNLRKGATLNTIQIAEHWLEYLNAPQEIPSADAQ